MAWLMEVWRQKWCLVRTHVPVREVRAGERIWRCSRCLAWTERVW